MDAVIVIYLYIYVHLYYTYCSLQCNDVLLLFAWKPSEMDQTLSTDFELNMKGHRSITTHYHRTVEVSKDGVVPVIRRFEKARGLRNFSNSENDVGAVYAKTSWGDAMSNLFPNLLDFLIPVHEEVGHPSRWPRDLKIA